MPAAFNRPIALAPLFMERVWGGRRLAEVYGKALPAGALIGESWEVVDRPDVQSVVRGGPLAGLDLHVLWRDHREAVFGARGLAHKAPRFPVLVKILDAQDALSVQVHPPPEAAARFGGATKNELWVITHGQPGAHVFAGLRAGVTRAVFEAALTAGQDVSTLLHKIEVSDGDAIYIPSGRVHAIGPGCMMFEVQQNSDTTYRVFDYNRPGLHGKRRDLHVEESLEAIDWNDVQPTVEPPHADGETVLDTPYFKVARWHLDAPRPATRPGECALVCGLGGHVTCAGVDLAPGEVWLVPAALRGAELEPARPGAEVLVVTLP